MRIITRLVLALLLLASSLAVDAQSPNTPTSQMEKLDRGVVALMSVPGQIFISWRYLGTDNNTTTFQILKDGVLTVDNICNNTCATIKATSGSFQVVTLQNGIPVDTTLAVKPWSDRYLPVKLDRPSAIGSVVYTPNDCSIGDVDGDGQYEIILKWDPSNSKDNASTGMTADVILDCYKLDGTKLWRIDLGKNIRAGAHYTQFLVYDFDKDGKAELICKTAPGSIDGAGKYVTAAATIDEIKNADNKIDYRDNGTGTKTLGHVLSGPEYLTVFNGLTGAAINTIFYNPNRAGELNKTSAYPDKNFWNDDYGNRADRFLACVAYLDGADKKPSAVMCRGYYTKAYLWAVDFDGSKLSTKWLHASVSKTEVDLYDANLKKTVKAYSKNTSGSTYSYTAWGNGNHNLSVADVDGDGCDEIMYGSCAINNDGNLLYSVGLGHGDAMHVADLNPDRPGYEVFSVHEESYNPYGYDIHDAATGEILNRGTSTRDTGRGLAADYDSYYRGAEYTYATQTSTYNINGTAIYSTNPGMNFRIFWDGDPYEELFDDVAVIKWNAGSTTTLGIGRSSISALGNPASCNGTKATPCLIADLFGDWREEVILWNKTDSTTLNIYTTTTLTDYRVPTLMHDHLYRMGIAWQNTAYNQPPHLGYYLPDYIGSFAGISTGISDIKKDDIRSTSVGKSQYYNINGLRVFNENLPKGIYIIKTTYPDGMVEQCKALIK